MILGLLTTEFAPASLNQLLKSLPKSYFNDPTKAVKVKKNPAAKRGKRNIFSPISIPNEKDLPGSNTEIIRKAKGIAKMDSRKKRIQTGLWLAATIAAFTLSFTVPKYFAQFLVAALILGFKWVSESENVRTLIVAMDAKRRHENKEEEILKWRR